MSEINWHFNIFQQKHYFFGKKLSYSVLLNKIIRL